jgi:signal peptidase I
MAVDLALRFAKLLAVFGILWTFLWFHSSYGCRRVEGQEMAPTFPMDKNLTLRPGRVPALDLERGDVVVYSHEIGGKGVKNLVGRVVGRPGDRVSIVKGEVHVNGEKLSETYVSGKNRGTDDYAEVLVPRGTVFLLGDNRNGAKGVDSRAVGPVSDWAVAGKVR